MKRIVFLLLFLSLILFFIFTPKKDNMKNDKVEGEIRAVFVSYIDYSSMLRDKKVEVAKANINTMIDNLRGNGFNTIIIQVRAFGDAIYNSSYFPVSSILADNYFDVLDYVIEVSKSKSLDVYAWINPYRVSNKKDFVIDNDSLYYNSINNYDIEFSDSGVYFNPASKNVLNLIINGIKEIVLNYDIDGILYDDYFYPNKTIDLNSFKEYQEVGGTKTLDKYRFDNINNLILSTYKAIKEIKKDVLFGISPAGNIEYDKNECYLDIEYILDNNLIDFIMPQLYYGFLNESKPFIDTLDEWVKINKTNTYLIPAFSMYKSGSIDNYARGGSEEWINNTDIIAKELIISRTKNNYKGFSVFRYDNLFNSSNAIMKEESANLFNLLK